LTALTVLVTTRNEEANVVRCLRSVQGWADQIFVLDSESTDRTVEISRPFAEVHTLAYDHSRIIPWIFQWGLDNLPIRNDWVLILEADQAVTPALRDEIDGAVGEAGQRSERGYYLKRRQIFRGKPLRFGGYGGKYLLKLFDRRHAALDPVEQDTRVYVKGPVAKLRAPLEEWNKKEDAILFYLEKHLRYAEAFAQEELKRRQGLADWKTRPKFLGTPDERILWMKSIYYRTPLYVRPAAYFFYRYFILLGILDGKTGFVFHFLQAFWFRFVVDVRLEELMRGQRDA
jgi:glycosyltransferase involved in cell wall biosynthesis